MAPLSWASPPACLSHPPSALTRDPEHQQPQELSREPHAEKSVRWFLISGSRTRSDLLSQSSLREICKSPGGCSRVERVKRRPEVEHFMWAKWNKLYSVWRKSSKDTNIGFCFQQGQTMKKYEFQCGRGSEPLILKKLSIDDLSETLRM